MLVLESRISSPCYLQFCLGHFRLVLTLWTLLFLFFLLCDFLLLSFKLFIVCDCDIVLQSSSPIFWWSATAWVVSFESALSHCSSLSSSPWHGTGEGTTRPREADVAIPPLAEPLLWHALNSPSSCPCNFNFFPTTDGPFGLITRAHSFGARALTGQIIFIFRAFTGHFFLLVNFLTISPFSGPLSNAPILSETSRF